MNQKTVLIVATLILFSTIAFAQQERFTTGDQTQQKRYIAPDDLTTFDTTAFVVPNSNWIQEQVRQFCPSEPWPKINGISFDRSKNFKINAGTGVSIDQGTNQLTINNTGSGSMDSNCSVDGNFVCVNGNQNINNNKNFTGKLSSTGDFFLGDQSTAFWEGRMEAFGNDGNAFSVFAIDSEDKGIEAKQGWKFVLGANEYALHYVAPNAEFDGRGLGGSSDTNLIIRNSSTRFIDRATGRDILSVGIETPPFSPSEGPVIDANANVRPHLQNTYSLGTSNFPWLTVVTGSIANATTSIFVSNIMTTNTSQTVSGIKSFLANPIISNVTPTLTFDHPLFNDDYTVGTNTSRFQIRNSSDNRTDIEVSGTGDVNITQRFLFRTDGNVTMRSPDGTQWNCGVRNDGVFACS